MEPESKKWVIQATRGGEKDVFWRKGVKGEEKNGAEEETSLQRGENRTGFRRICGAATNGGLGGGRLCGLYPLKPFWPLTSWILSRPCYSSFDISLLIFPPCSVHCLPPGCLHSSTRMPAVCQPSIDCICMSEWWRQGSDACGRAATPFLSVCDSQDGVDNDESVQLDLTWNHFLFYRASQINVMKRKRSKIIKYRSNEDYETKNEHICLTYTILKAAPQCSKWRRVHVTWIYATIKTLMTGGTTA